MRILLFALLLFLSHGPVVIAAPIHDAAKSGDIAELARLLAEGADENASNGLATPLFYAVQENHLEAATLLLASGARPDAPSIWGPPLIAAAHSGNVELIRLLLGKGADPNGNFKTRTALHIAAETGFFDGVKALVESGADVNAITNVGEPVLHVAKRSGHADIGDYLATHGAVTRRPPAIAPLLATADAERGQAAFIRNCNGCHFVEPGKGRKYGPDLWGVVGSARATRAEGGYSDAMLAWKGTWTFEDINVLITAPMETLPGTFMETSGVPNETDRADIIAYLNTLSDHPLPLP
jgi:cytochrome c